VTIILSNPLYIIAWYRIYLQQSMFQIQQEVLHCACNWIAFEDEGFMLIDEINVMVISQTCLDANLNPSNQC
jgi:hypothetical protein